MRKSHQFVIRWIFLWLFIGGYAQNQSKDFSGEIKKLIKTNPDSALARLEKIKNEYSGDSLVMYDVVKLTARAFDKKQEYDSSKYYLELERDYALHFRDSTDLYYTYSDLAWIYAYKKEYQKSIEQYQLARKYFQSYRKQSRMDTRSKRNLARLLNGIGAMYIKLEQYDSALHYLYQSLKIREEVNAPPRMIIAGKFNIGSCYVSMHDYPNALNMLLQVNDLAKENKDTVYLIKSYNNLGVTYAWMGEDDKAIKAYRNALSIAESAGLEKNLLDSYQNLADLYLKKKKFTAAKKLLQKSLKLCNEQNINPANIYLSYAQLAYEQGDFPGTVSQCRKTLPLANRSSHNKVIIGAYELMYRSYKAMGDYRNALSSYEKLTSLNESQMEASRNEYIDKLKIEFETEQKKKEIEYLKALNASEKKAARLSRNRQRIIIASILAGMIFLAITLYSVIQKRKKDKLLHKSEKKYLEAHLLNSELEKKQLDQEIKNKNKELTTQTLKMIQRNQLIDDVLKKLDDIKKNLDGEKKTRIKNIMKELVKSQKDEKEWELFQYYFERVHKHFNNKLAAVNPNLNMHDYRIAALIYLNLNIKESAALLNISPNSVKVARYRLRRRLGLEKKQDLYVFLHSL